MLSGHYGAASVLARKPQKKSSTYTKNCLNICAIGLSSVISANQRRFTDCMTKKGEMYDGRATCSLQLPAFE
jgi:hypothetical protein